MTSIFRDGLFDGKVIVVSGGGTGIGRAIARELASLGATVVICSALPSIWSQRARRSQRRAET